MLLLVAPLELDGRDGFYREGCQLDGNLCS